MARIEIESIGPHQPSIAIPIVSSSTCLVSPFPSLSSCSVKNGGWILRAEAPGHLLMLSHRHAGRRDTTKPRGR